ncbi:MAG: class I SAM-dependent methyltransferase [Spirochaetia bacterium]
MSEGAQTDSPEDLSSYLTGKLDIDAFAALLGTSNDEISAKCGDIISQFDFRYEVLKAHEIEHTIIDVLKAIDNGMLKSSGRERKQDWERGWQENWDDFASNGFDVSRLEPRYISKYGISRLFSHYIRPNDPKFELNFYTVFRHFIFRTYLFDYEDFFEFGCGTGYNLIIMNRLFPGRKITGLDWTESSVRIANELGRRLGANLSGRQFDYFQPDPTIHFSPKSAVVTLNSLEQVGNEYKAFLDFLLTKKPAICINSEPILEMYDEGNLLDYLAARYHKRRNYLNGYYSELKKLAQDGKIAIDRAQRVRMGNLFHEGYSFVVWHVRS